VSSAHGLHTRGPRATAALASFPQRLLSLLRHCQPLTATLPLPPMECRGVPRVLETAVSDTWVREVARVAVGGVAVVVVHAEDCGEA
jgi:hypothetical protein